MACMSPPFISPALTGAEALGSGASTKPSSLKVSVRHRGSLESLSGQPRNPAQGMKAVLSHQIDLAYRVKSSSAQSVGSEPRQSGDQLSSDLLPGVSAQEGEMEDWRPPGDHTSQSLPGSLPQKPTTETYKATHCKPNMQPKNEIKLPTRGWQT